MQKASLWAMLLVLATLAALAPVALGSAREPVSIACADTCPPGPRPTAY